MSDMKKEEKKKRKMQLRNAGGRRAFEKISKHSKLPFEKSML
jgi:hypothetical protein